MDFTLDADHLALRDAVRRWCDGELPAPARGAAPDVAARAHLQAGLAALGVSGLLVDGAHGGSGLGGVELMLVAQEFGRALVAGPWLPSAVMAAPLIAAAGDARQRERWLPALVRGERSAALACHEPGARYALDAAGTTARRDGAGWRLAGRKAHVLDGDAADLLLIVARAGEGPTLFAIDAQTPGLRRLGHDTLDGRRAAAIELADVQVGDERRLGPVGGALPFVQSTIDRAEAALCAEAAGSMEALLALTAEHLRTRTQFGAPLARLQALQHRVADIAIALEQVRSMACVAALALQAPEGRERERLLSAAKALVAPLARRVAFDAIQLHGAMGMTEECPAARHAKRLIGIGQWFGDADFHLRRFASRRPPDPASSEGEPR